ncbi:hypothetical protein E2562_030591 [Oryza meyeriana var. granulata]|uniref:DUF7705 domain-containing protein n=1 Tax=Oryza meyeriana var. granulata TaxID=110450 RepID=A0A6G1ER88_9ORYZ|nr:hypothetical protein E2562_030591 [Oryza meyeriana var. granulata]
MAVRVADVASVLVLSCWSEAKSITTNGRGDYVSAVGDPGMRRDGLRVAWEAWNFCNEVGREAPGMGSPRGADCFELGWSLHPAVPFARIHVTVARLVKLVCQIDGQRGEIFAENGVDENGQRTYKVVHRVTDADNNLRAGDPFPGAPANITDIDLYAPAKELYLGNLCQVADSPAQWQFWMIMLKNGNLDTTAAICPKNGRPARPIPQSRFPCPGGAGCMNQPLVFHNRTELDKTGRRLHGGLFGTYDLDAADLGSKDVSYYSVTWEKQLGSGGTGGWVFHHKLRTSPKYPWLMLYLRSDATTGFSGGYHYETRGMTKIVLGSPNFKVRVTLEVKQGGGPSSQFYLMDMGSCWKNDGRPCDGDVTTDVTRYSEMIINPETPSWCTPGKVGLCPPWHTFRNGTRVHRTDATRFPYAAYHMYCSPGNARAAEQPTTPCDAYSNPQQQEILQLVPHPVWGEFGYPTAKRAGLDW